MITELQQLESWNKKLITVEERLIDLCRIVCISMQEFCMSVLVYAINSRRL